MINLPSFAFPSTITERSTSHGS